MIKFDHLQMEITNYCNLACVECPHRMMKRKLEHMESDVFNKIMSIIEPMKPTTVIVHKDGEPLMHPKFVDMFRTICATVPYSKIDIYTNAYFLKPKLFEELMKAKVNNKVWFLMTIHGHDYRGEPYDLRKPGENILACLDLIRAKKWKNVEFVITSHKTDYVSQQNMKMYYDYWTAVKANNRPLRDVHANADINPWGQRIKMKEGMVHFEACPYGDGAHFFIGVTGNGLPCCMDLDEEIVFGNIMTDDLNEIEAKRQDFYETMRINKERKYKLCQKCLSSEPMEKTTTRLITRRD